MLDKKEGKKKKADKTVLAEIPQEKTPTNALKIIVATIVGIGVGIGMLFKSRSTLSENASIDSK